MPWAHGEPTPRRRAVTDSAEAAPSLRAFLEAMEDELAGLEGAEAVPAVAYSCARGLAFDEDALRAALRRTVFVVAAGGDPHRELSPDDVAVRRLAAELDAPARRVELERALEDVARTAAGLEIVSRAVSILRHDADLAWRWAALALLAAEIAGEPAS